MSRKVVAVVIVAVSGALLVVALVAISVGAQQECPSPQLIDTITGNGDQQSPPFTTTTNLFRISYDVQAPRETAPFSVRAVSADNPDAPSVGNVSIQGSRSGEGFVNAPPGRYYLDITALSQYTITLESCESGGQATPNEGTSTQSTTQPKAATPPAQPTVSPPSPPKAPPVQQQPSPSSQPSPIQSQPQGPTFKAGGPSDGPVPLMPGGSCPKEFPVARGGACFR